MTSFASALKHEITRLARKEIRVQVDSTKKAAARHRREIAELKRVIGQLSRRVADLERQVQRGRAASPARAAAPSIDAAASTGDGPKHRFSPVWLRDHRERIAVSAADYARLVGVSTLTIYNWEHEKTRPRAKQVAVLAEIRKLGKREAWRRLEAMDAAE